MVLGKEGEVCAHRDGIHGAGTPNAAKGDKQAFVGVHTQMRVCDWQMVYQTVFVNLHSKICISRPSDVFLYKYVLTPQFKLFLQMFCHSFNYSCCYFVQAYFLKPFDFGFGKTSYFPPGTNE